MALAFGGFCAQGAQVSLAFFPATWITSRLRYLVFDTLLKQELGFFENPNGRAAGAWVSLLQEKVRDVQDLLGSSFTTRLQGVSCLFIGLGFAFEAAPLLALAMCGLLPFLIGATMMAGKVADRRGASGSKGLKKAQAEVDVRSDNFYSHDLITPESKIRRDCHSVLNGSRRVSFKQSVVRPSRYCLNVHKCCDNTRHDATP